MLHLGMVKHCNAVGTQGQSCQTGGAGALQHVAHTTALLTIACCMTLQMMSRSLVMFAGTYLNSRHMYIEGTSVGPRSAVNLFS